jgi:hypothetical protein
VQGKADAFDTPIKDFFGKQGLHVTSTAER